MHWKNPPTGKIYLYQIIHKISCTHRIFCRHHYLFQVWISIYRNIRWCTIYQYIQSIWPWHMGLWPTSKKLEICLCHHPDRNVISCKYPDSVQLYMEYAWLFCSFPIELHIVSFFCILLHEDFPLVYVRTLSFQHS